MFKRGVWNMMDTKILNRIATDGMKKRYVPSHYDMPIQPIEYIMRNNLDYCSANIIKYASRWDKKGQPREDLEKIIHYARILCDKL